jgi:hypothetical protein
MTIAYSQLFAPNQVNNAAVETLYNVPSSPTTSILRNARVRFSNTTGGAVTIKAWAVPSAGTAGDDNVFLPTTSINANSYLDIDVPVIAAGGMIQAQAGAATSITATALDGFVQS